MYKGKAMQQLLKTTQPIRTAEDRLEHAQQLVNHLELYVSALSRMSYDNMPSEEFNALMNTLHLQVHELSQHVHTA